MNSKLTKTYVAFLRGINVGGNAILLMSELKMLCEKLGFENVHTHIQSGNVIFNSGLSKEILREQLETALDKKIGKRVVVAVRTMDELVHILKKNPFPKAEAAKVGVMFFTQPIQKDFLSGISTSTGEEVSVNKWEAYIHYPNGMGRSKLKLPQQSDEGTVRNINIIQKLIEICKVLKEKPIVSFSTAQEWHTWLTKNHASSSGVRLQIFKKSSEQKSISYDEALDEALCFGWIDGQMNKHDAESWIQNFVPRRPKSLWSKRNREHIARLIKERRMKPAGLKAVEAAKNDGRWDLAYDSPKNMEIPPDFSQELKKDKKAFAFFKTLNKKNVYTIAWRLQTAKRSETRGKRMKIILAMLARCEKFY